MRVRARARACFFVFQSVLLILQAPYDDVSTVLKGYGVSIHLYIAMNMRTCQLPSLTTRMKFTHLPANLYLMFTRARAASVKSLQNTQHYEHQYAERERNSPLFPSRLRSPPLSRSLSLSLSLFLCRSKGRVTGERNAVKTHSCHGGP